MKIYFQDIEIFLGQAFGPIYVFIASRVIENYTDSLLTLSSFNKYNHVIEICEKIGEIQSNDNKALERLLDRALDREKVLTDNLIKKGYNVLPGYVASEPIPIDKIDEQKI